MVFWESWVGVSSVLSFGYSSDADSIEDGIGGGINNICKWGYSELGCCELRFVIWVFK